jgi:hypothetical protein
VSARSGCGLVELAVVESIAALTAGKRPWYHVTTSRALADVEERIGLGPRYGYRVLIDLARQWTVAVRLISGRGNFGDRAFPEPALAHYTRSRQTAVGQLVLNAEVGRLAPVPVGLINGSLYRGGRQPPLEPFAVIDALRKLLKNPRTPNSELLDLVGGPYSVTGCDIDGDLAGLISGRPAHIVETARIAVTGTVVSTPTPTPTRLPRSSVRHIGTAGEAAIDHPSFQAHVIIESLPAEVTVPEAVEAVLSRSESPRWRDDYPALADQALLPVADLAEVGDAQGVRIELKLSPGSDPVAVRRQLRDIHGLSWSRTCQFPAPLATVLRSWVRQYRGEDLAAGLDQLEQAIHDDRTQ